jgi:hypothetical protein
MITFEKRVSPVYEIVECPVGSCWRFGSWFYAKVVSENAVIQLFDAEGSESIAINKSMTSNEWLPSDNDTFVAAYCRTINGIAKISGIEHLPLIMEPDFLTESNPE